MLLNVRVDRPVATTVHTFSRRRSPKTDCAVRSAEFVQFLQQPPSGVAMRAIRRSLILLPLGLAVLVGFALRSPAANPLEKMNLQPANGITPISLRDRLVVGLQARLPSEVAFCELVALKVQTGKLPVLIVDQTFFWARDRANVQLYGPTDRPIIYFRPAMKLRAQRLHINL